MADELILVVDDDNMNLMIAQHMLKDVYHVHGVKSGTEALDFLESNTPNLILLDLHMPDMNGFEVLERIKSNPNTEDIPVIFLTADDDRQAEVKGFQMGALDFITKPFVAEIVHQRVNRLLELDHLQKHLQQEVTKQTATAEERRKKMEQMSFQTVQTLANAIDAKDKYTNGHSSRVSQYSAQLAKELGWGEERVESLRYASLLHDIGKIGVPDSVLNKPGRLTDVEFDVIKSHTSMGADILKTITTIPSAEEVARHHHERFDGNGYPDKLAGEDIPIEARVVCVADSYDAMSSKRIYRNTLSREVIRNELINGRGTQFDPDILDVFLKMFDENRLEVSKDKAETLNEDKDITNESSILLEKVMQTMATQKSEEVDMLTGLDLRGVGQVKISEEMQKADGYLAFIDLDNLKKINDTFGHKSGDRVLKLLGELILGIEEATARCRIGGDEFLMYLPIIDEDRIREIVSGIIDDFNEKKNVDPTIKQASVSVGLCKSTTTDAYDDIVGRADKALYHVKQNGKSGYFFYQQGNGSSKQKSDIDLKQLVKSLENSGSYSGAMDVEYREFAKLYEYVGNLQKRYNHDFNLLMITLEENKGENLFIDEMENAMSSMEVAIRETIRNVDICTRYSSVQFLVILLEAGDANVDLIVNRIFNAFYKNYTERKVQPRYDVAVLSSDN